MKPKVKAIYTLYRHGKLTKAQGACVCAGSADGGEYKTITGEEYTA